MKSLEGVPKKGDKGEKINNYKRGAMLTQMILIVPDRGVGEVSI